MVTLASTEDLNRAKYQPGQADGHYESFYLRGNAPDRPLAFWIRYTIFSPRSHPEFAIGELWAVVFDGETGRHVVTKEEYPLADCHFDRDRFSVNVGGHWLSPERLAGRCSSSGSTVSWSLSYNGDQPPLYLLPVRLYGASFPKAKSLVSLPMATFHGELVVNGHTIAVQDWVGSQNHNWGSRHTDHYAFGQVAGFDDAPDSFLEVVSARVKLGPISTPTLTPMVLRHRGSEHSLVALHQSACAKGRFGYFSWSFASENDAVRIEGRITAPPDAFVGLRYYNPPGGIKHCLNTKIGSCELRLLEKSTGRQDSISSRNRALFEILTDDRSHGIAISA